MMVYLSIVLFNGFIFTLTKNKQTNKNKTKQKPKRLTLDSNPGPLTCKTILTIPTPARDVIQQNDYQSYIGPVWAQ